MGGNFEGWKCLARSCDKKIVHKSGYCAAHRGKKCAQPGCGIVITQSLQYQFCSKHRISKHKMGVNASMPECEGL